MEVKLQEINQLSLIFKSGSRTFYNSSKFFPKPYRKQVIVLYAFVRSVDDFVDSIPQMTEDYYKFKQDYNLCLKNQKADNLVIKSFVKLKQELKLPDSWIEAFFSSMEMDLNKKVYYSIDEVKQYMYGSAEIIGLIMCKIMKLPEKSYPYACLVGRAFQYINFIRDIQEDIHLNRNYFPRQDYQKFNIVSKSLDESQNNSEQMINFIRYQINRSRQWLDQGEYGFRYIPHRFLVPIRTASSMYRWTLDKIDVNPLIVYNEKIKPNKLKILQYGLKNLIYF
ncbi:MAG: hypothetical protein APR63_04510 [Desulfuromonas sp. SDB]|nr:MAG: hypothetical protein APR63_04510 [Desulfuromonas sp. SDB]